jgi:hypothetical protein
VCCGRKWYSSAETKETCLEKQLAAERAQHDQTRADRDANRRQLSASRGQVTKIKNRVGNGVCPCCDRSFTNLRRHMSTQHPAWKKTPDA